jgi:protease I
MNREGRVIGAIGLGPEVLARAGILKGRRATVTRNSIKMIRELGAWYYPRQVVRDGNVVTAIGPWATKSFAYSVIKALMYNE